MEQEMWLIRYKDNTLCLIIGAKPVKLQFIWHYPTDAIPIKLDNRLYPEVKWSDKEPTKVKIIIEK